MRLTPGGREAGALRPGTAHPGPVAGQGESPREVVGVAMERKSVTLGVCCACERGRTRFSSSFSQLSFCVRCLCWIFYHARVSTWAEGGVGALRERVSEDRRVFDITSEVGGMGPLAIFPDVSGDE